jgi:hypothetical protein
LANRDLIKAHVARVGIGRSSICIDLKNSLEGNGSHLNQMTVPWEPPGKQPLVRIEDADVDSAPEPNPGMVQALARAHSWLRLLSDGSYDSIEALAGAKNINPKAIRAAFIAPDISSAILTGSQTKALTLAQLQETLPLDWHDQRRQLKFNPTA